MTTPTDVTITDGTTTKTYLIDRGGDFFKGYWKHESIPFLRPQQDTARNPSESSINPEIGWLRSFESWHHGSGQTYQDRQDSDQYRFRSSKGVDIWTKWQLQLLNTTTKVLASAVTDLLVAGGLPVMYLIDSTNAKVKVTFDLTTYTDMTGFGAVLANGLTSDGSTVWFANGTDGVYTCPATGIGTGLVGALYAGPTADPATVVAYVKGRLMVASNNGKIWNLTTAGAFPTPLFTSPNSSFAWIGFSEGSHCIYAVGNGLSASGFGGQVYRINIKSDGTGLDPPIPASPGLPRGEVFVGKGIGNYLGFVFLTTSKGIRFCTQDANGDLSVGAPISITPYGAMAVFGNDRFIYFGWPGYDSVSCGLGRLDLTVLVDANALEFAYASDLMAAVTNSNFVTAIASLNGRLVFAAWSGTAGQAGLFAQNTTAYVPSATLDSGYITYNISDPKAPQKITANVRSFPSGGGGTVGMSLDDAAFSSILTIPASANGQVSSAISGTTTAARVELRTTLTSDGTATPTLTRETLLSEVVVPSGFMLNIPVLIADSMVGHGDGAFSLDVLAEQNQLITWRTNRTPLTITYGTRSFTGIIREIRENPDQQTEDGTSISGAFLLMVKTNP